MYQGRRHTSGLSIAGASQPPRRKSSSGTRQPQRRRRRQRQSSDSSSSSSSPPRRNIGACYYPHCRGYGLRLIYCSGGCFRQAHLSCIREIRLPNTWKWMCQGCTTAGMPIPVDYVRDWDSELRALQSDLNGTYWSSVGPRNTRRTRSQTNYEGLTTPERSRRRRS